MAGSVEEDEVVIVRDGISKTGVNSGCAYWTAPFPLNWVLDNAPSKWIPTSAVTTFVPRMTPSLDAHFLTRSSSIVGPMVFRSQACRFAFLWQDDSASALTLSRIERIFGVTTRFVATAGFPSFVTVVSTNCAYCVTVVVTGLPSEVIVVFCTAKSSVLGPTHS